MAVLDEDFVTDLTPAAGDCGTPITAEPVRQPLDWPSLYERERARANAAEARCEELRRAEVDARARSGSLKWQLDKSRSKLKAAVEETQEVRRAAKGALSLQAEVARLTKLLSDAGVETAKRRASLSHRR